jgi:hypothetical protein
MLPKHNRAMMSGGIYNCKGRSRSPYFLFSFTINAIQ